MTDIAHIHHVKDLLQVTRVTVIDALGRKIETEGSTDFLFRMDGTDLLIMHDGDTRYGKLER